MYYSTWAPRSFVLQEAKTAKDTEATAIASPQVAYVARTSKKGPSGHIKFDHIFQICFIITKDLFKEIP